MRNILTGSKPKAQKKEDFRQLFVDLSSKKATLSKLLTSGIIVGSVLLSACSDLTPESGNSDFPTQTSNQNTILSLVKSQSEPLIINANSTFDSDQTENLRATTAPGVDRGRFNITLKFITPVTDRQNEVFTSAAARWERIIIGDIPSITGTLPSAFQGFPPVVQNGTIDDLIIEVAIAPIDGAGGILGQAGPRFLRLAGGLPVSGVMFFDVDDLDFLEELDLFEDVIVHEMGHVLGVGTIWNSSGRTLREGPASNPFFNGQAANVHWNSFGGAGLLPIENIGGQGTAGSHWRESILRNELMTGFLNLGTNSLSRITAASMNDLGYRAAVVGERYELPLLNARVEGHEGEGINIGEMELLLEPIGYVTTENQ